MMQLVITLIIMMTTDLTSGQYPDCVTCSSGSIPLSPLSYNTVRSNMFRGTQPSNDGCANEGQKTINCIQETTLIDCDLGGSVDYSDLNNFFTWNTNASLAELVSVDFRFNQEINISSIRMFFWNSPINSVIVPNIKMYWADRNLQFTLYKINITSSPNRTDNGQNRLNIDSISDFRLQLKYLRIEMSFYDDNWIFLSEVQFCGNTAPFRIIQPSTENHVQAVTSTRSQVNVTCSVNANISEMVIVWFYNSSAIQINRVSHIQSGNTTTLLISNFQPSDAGVYQCVFSDQASSGWTIRRNIILIINDSPTSTASTMLTTAPSTIDVYTTASTTNTVAVTTTTDSPSVTTTTTTTTTLTAATTTATNSTVSAISGDDSNNVGVIVAPIIVIIVVIIIIVAVGLIILFFWRKKQKSYQVSDDVEFTKKSSHESAHIKSKNGNTSKSKNTQYINIENPPLLYAVPSNNEKNHLEMSQDSLINGETVELDIYGTVQGHAKSNTMVDNPIYNLENQIYDEAISPAAIISGLSHDKSSLYENSACPFGSIYDDPLPLVKSEGPPIVSGKNIKLLRPLGVGQFGEVMLAKTVELSSKYLGIGNSSDTSISMKVAIKTLKSASSEESRKSFEKEIKFMSRLKDDNVVRVLAICTTGTPFIVMEYMENGDLNNYLQKFEFTYKSDKLPAENEITLNALIYVSFQIASGMEYLSSHKFIHRDLAARNVLVGINYIVKIADFGLSQNMYSGYYCRVTGRNVLPIRWMAYESFFGKFSIQTDVWSFGITLWEIFTLCRERPFDDLTDQELIEDAIKGASRRLPGQPDVCPNEVYSIMKSCLQHEPLERAKFNLLCDQLNEFYTKLL